MTNEKKKGPFADVGDETDWDKALDAWDLGDQLTAAAEKSGASPDEPPAPLPEEGKPNPTGGSAPRQGGGDEPRTALSPERAQKHPLATGETQGPEAGRGPKMPGGLPRTSAKPLYTPHLARSLTSSQGLPGSKAPERRTAPPKDAEDKTSIATVSPELLERAAAAVSQGTGLGQALRTTDLSRPRGQDFDVPVVFSESTPSDGLIDALLDKGGREPPRIDEPSVVTSAPKVDVNRAHIPATERKTAKQTEALDDVPDGSLYDPFADETARRTIPSERGPTLRPGAPVPGQAAAGKAGPLPGRVAPSKVAAAPAQARQPTVPRPGQPAGAPRGVLPGAASVPSTIELDDEPTTIMHAPERPSVRPAQARQEQGRQEQSRQEQSRQEQSRQEQGQPGSPVQSPGVGSGARPGSVRPPAAGFRPPSNPPAGPAPGTPVAARPGAPRTPATSNTETRPGSIPPAAAPKTEARSGSVPPPTISHTAGSPVSLPVPPAVPRIAPAVASPARPPRATTGDADPPRPSATSPARGAHVPSPAPQAIRLDRLPMDSSDDLEKGQQALFERLEESFGTEDELLEGANTPGSPTGAASITVRPMDPVETQPAPVKERVGDAEDRIANAEDRPEQDTEGDTGAGSRPVEVKVPAGIVEGARGLADPSETDAWRQRATWLEEETRAKADRVARGSGLLIASELFALADDEAHASKLASEARDLDPSHPLAHRQARGWAVRDGNWTDVLQSLQHEFRTTTSPPARAHASLFAAEIGRLATSDSDLTVKRLEQASRAWPVDPRAYVWRIAEAVAQGSPLPKLRLPEGAELPMLADALGKLQAWRSAETEATPDDQDSIRALLSARRALAGGDLPLLATSLEALGKAAGLRDAGTWLLAALRLARPEDEEQAGESLKTLSDGSSGAMARRALAALALGREKHDRALELLRSSPEDTFRPDDRVVIGLLAKSDFEGLEPSLGQIEAVTDLRALARGARAALGAGTAKGEASLGDDPTNPEMLRLGRLLASEKSASDIEAFLESAGTAAGALTSILQTELDLETDRVEALAERFSASLEDESKPGEQRRDRALLAALIYEIKNYTALARRLYEKARQFDPEFEAAMRAQMACSDSAERPALLLEQESVTSDVGRASLLILEAALSGTDPDTYAALLTRAHQKAPSIPFAAWLSERRARARGELETIIRWLRDRREATSDPVEAAHDRVREALLIAEEDPALARQLLEEATAARPSDLALRELYERLAPEPPDWMEYWTAQASEQTGADRARIQTMLALEHEHRGEWDLAAETARQALEVGNDPLARLCLDRVQMRGANAQQLTEQLIEAARGSEDSKVRIENYERLAAIDEASGAASGSIPWHRTILDENPGHFPSLCRLEQAFITEGREQDLVALLAHGANRLASPESTAHAELAARFMAKSAPWQATRELVELAFDRSDGSLWALREMEAHAIVAQDAARELSAVRRLAERTIRTVEVATLSLRGAEAAARLHNQAQVRELLERTVELDSQNLVAQRALAALCVELGDPRRAAEAYEAIAEHSTVPDHQVAAWYEAGTLWIDRVSDTSRGRMALERVAGIDLTHGETFERLQALYVGAADREALAELLDQRLALAKSDVERVELEVVRGRTLADMGDRQAAKRALAFALEQSPDHVSALAAFADVCAREEDFAGAEQAYIRLARLVTEPSEQASIYTKLGEIYDRHQPNLERAELAYGEVLRRVPGDEHAQERLIDICERAGQWEKAIQMQQALLSAASRPEARRRRTIELAGLHERSGDTKKAESILDGARKEFPNDVEVLTALVEYHKRAGRTSTVQALLDRATGDARRALWTGRFDLHLFSVLATVARLRERASAALIAEATVAALEGRPHELRGTGIAPIDASLDDLLAPEILTPALRGLLRKTGEMLDAAAPVDFNALRAGPLSEPIVVDQIRVLAEPFGFESLEVFVSPALGAVCLPACSAPAQIVLGSALVSSTDGDIRAFLIARALKIIQARASALARSAPIELLPLMSAYLKTLAPAWQPTGVDPGKVRDLQAKIEKAKPDKIDPDVEALATEVSTAIGNRTSTLNTIVSHWGNRLALLWFGDLTLGFGAIARAVGHNTGPAASGSERLTWIGRNAEARDLAIFSVSDAYAEARSKLGM